MLRPEHDAELALRYALVAERDRARDIAVALEGQVAAVRALAEEWEARGEYGDASLTQGARAIRAALDPEGTP